MKHLDSASIGHTSRQSRKWLFAALTMTACCAPAALRADNLLKNPGFEEGLKNWSVSATRKVPSFLTAVDDAGYSGKKSLRAVFDAERAPGVYSTIWQKVPVRPDSRYRIRLMAKAAKGDRPIVFGGGAGWKIRFATAPGPYDWKEFSGEFTTGPKEREFDFRLIIENRAADTLIDDIVIERIPGADEPFSSPVSAYGAVGDGRTDATEAFRKAFEAGNQEVIVPPGRYSVKTIAVPAGATLRGLGSQSQLIVQEGSKAAVTLGAGATVSHLAIQASAKTDGVFSARSRDVRIAAVEFNNVRFAVHLDHADGARVTDCRIRNAEKAMELVFSGDLRLTGNDIADCRKHGIQFWGNYHYDPAKRCRNLIITGNRVRNGGDGAIWGTGYTDIVVSGNLVDGARDVGIDLEWCDDAAITGNVVRNTRNGGISLFFSCRRVTIAGNTVINDWKFDKPLNAGFAIRSGIWLTYLNTEAFKGDSGHEDVTIAGNTIFNPDTERRAMFIGTGSKRIRISGNAVNQGEIWIGGEHKKPLDLKHLPNGSLLIDDAGKIAE